MKRPIFAAFANPDRLQTMRMVLLILALILLTNVSKHAGYTGGATITMPAMPATVGLPD